VKNEVKLSGGEIMMLKALGLSGSPVYGKLFRDRMKELPTAEFLDTLNGLVAMGYVLSSKVNIVKMEEVERAYLRVNPSYARDLRNSMRPKSSRTEERGRPRRRG
jgi:hypothetical protein